MDVHRLMAELMLSFIAVNSEIRFVLKLSTIMVTKEPTCPSQRATRYHRYAFCCLIVLCTKTQNEMNPISIADLK